MNTTLFLERSWYFLNYITITTSQASVLRQRLHSLKPMRWEAYMTCSVKRHTPLFIKLNKSQKNVPHKTGNTTNFVQPLKHCYPEESTELYVYVLAVTNLLQASNKSEKKPCNKQNSFFFVFCPTTKSEKAQRHHECSCFPYCKENLCQYTKFKMSNPKFRIWCNLCTKGKV